MTAVEPAPTQAERQCADAGQIEAAIRPLLDVHHHATFVQEPGDEVHAACVNQQGGACSAGWTGAKSDWRDHLAATLAARLAAIADGGLAGKVAALGRYVDELAVDNIVSPDSKFTRDVIVRELRALLSDPASEEES